MLCIHFFGLADYFTWNAGGLMERVLAVQGE